MAGLILFWASLLGGFVFPWWWPAVAAYGVGVWLPRSGWTAFLSGFLGTGLAWLVQAAFLDWRNHHLLSGRIAGVFHLPNGIFLLAAAGLLGGGVAGLAAWAGWSLRAYLKPRLAAAAGTGNSDVTGAGPAPSAD